MENGNGHFAENGKFLPGNGITRKGSPNVISQKVKKAIVNFLENNVDKIQESFDTLKAREKLQFIAEILPYAAPKLSSVQTEVEGEIDHRITVTWEMPNLNFDELQGRTHKGSLGE